MEDLGETAAPQGHNDIKTMDDCEEASIAAVVVQSIAGDVIAKVVPAEKTVAALRDAVLPYCDPKLCQPDLLQGEHCLVTGDAFHDNGLPITLVVRGVRRPIVIDAGSGTCKVGFAEDNAPISVFPSVVGYASREESSLGLVVGDVVVGKEAVKKKLFLQVRFPIEYGLVTDWDGIQAIWRHCFFNELRVNAEDHPVLLTDAPMSPKVNRERATQLMFEAFNVPKLHLALDAVVALYASGRTTGLSITCGDSVTRCVPVYEGYALPHAIRRFDSGGRCLTNHMKRLLVDAGHTFAADATEWVCLYKETVCYVALDFDAEMNAVGDEGRDYELPDGSVMKPGTEQICCPEAIFTPQLIGSKAVGLHERAHQCIRNCDIDIRADLYRNIVLSGGHSMFPGLAARLRKELLQLAYNTCECNVIDTPDRKYGVWIGGSILASLETFHSQWMMKSEYDEQGPTLVHRKCCC